MPDYDNHNTITIRETRITILSIQGSNIMILSAFPNQINFIGFIKTGLPVKTPNITALSIISFAIILTNIFCKAEVLSLLILC